jgi:RNA recognition motif-containing protein
MIYALGEKQHWLCLYPFPNDQRKEVLMNIYIGNLSISTTEEYLKTLFAEFGEIESLKVIKDRYSGRSKGYGFIEMPSNSEAEQAILALNKKRIDGNNIKVRAADSGRRRSKKKLSRRRYY